jgi:DNA polymerase IV
MVVEPDREAAPSVSLQGLCRDCLASLADDRGQKRCPNCGGPRLIAHPELFSLTTAHVDCDAFYAAIEKRDRPELMDQPVIVGGGRRGVVATACYVARTFGVHSAMPMFKALEACPHAVVIPPDMAKYAHVGRAVRELMLALTPAVEPLSIDEAFLDLAGTERLHGAPPALTLARFQRRVETELGITVSIGLSHNKFLAKIASDLDKPRGLSAIGRAETLSFLAAQPVSLIWGVGKVFKARLARDGITHIADLQKLDEDALVKRYGSMGSRLARLSRGLDDRSVAPDREAVSVSAETTFERDLASAQDLIPILRSLSEKVSGRLKKQDARGRLVVLKLKTGDFRTRTRQRLLEEQTNLAGEIFAAGSSLLANELDGSSFRLIGIGVGQLSDPDEHMGSSLIDQTPSRRAIAEHAIDNIRSRFGPDGVALGLTFGAKSPRGGRRST